MGKRVCCGDGGTGMRRVRGKQLRARIKKGGHNEGKMLSVASESLLLIMT